MCYPTASGERSPEVNSPKCRMKAPYFSFIRKRRTAGRFDSVPGSHTQSLGRLRKSLASKAKVAQEVAFQPK